MLALNYPKGAADKLYLTCRVKQDGNVFRVDINSQDRAVWLDEGFRQKYGVPDDHVIRNRETGERFAQGDHGLHLVSAGTYLWLGDKLVTLRRDEDAPSYAGALTEAAGRCGELPRKTMLKELNEEIFAASRKDGEISNPVFGCDDFILGFTDGNYSVNEVRAIRRNQIKEKGLIAGMPIEVVKLDEHTPKELDTSTAEIWLDDELVDRIDGPHFFDDVNQTLEVRQSYLLPDTYQIREIIDGEPYGRPVVVKSLIELAMDGEAMTPCLENATIQAMTRLKMNQERQDEGDRPGQHTLGCIQAR